MSESCWTVPPKQRYRDSKWSAIASLADYRCLPDLDTPATPERILAAVEEIKKRGALDGSRRAADAAAAGK